MEIRVQRFYYPAILIVLLIGVLATGCKKEEFNTSPDFRLAFSTDTVSFDTVFQSIGSATRLLKVYNRTDEFVVIDRISVIDSCDRYDPFRVNVDGISGSTVRDIEIGPNDSIFIFVEVTIDPEQICSALELGVVEFSVNGNQQYVTLFAYGLDAIFYTPTVFPDNGLPAYTLIDTTPGATITWTSDKPIVVYGYAVVDEGQRLIVEPGTQVYFHRGSGLWVFEGGSIQAGSSTGEAVVFQGDRLEEFFSEEPGQWDRIWILGGTVNNSFENTIIKNNFIGIQVEPSPFDPAISNSLVDNRLILKNVAIRNNSIAGIFSRNYRIQAENLLVSSSGQNCLAATGAGQYRFDHCTFANNWSASTRQTPAVFLTNLYQVDSQTLGVGNILESRFRNCIVYGNGLNEFGLDFETSSANIDLSIDHTLIRMQEDDFLELDQSYFAEEIFVGFDPGFINFSGGDFRLREDAFARSKGNSQGGLPDTDIIGTPYNNPRPLGCFEYLPE